MAMHILMAVLAALGIPLDNIVLNRTTLQEQRKINRQKQFEETKNEFIDNVIYLNLISYYF